MGMGEKPRNIYKRKPTKKFPVLLPSHPPSTKMEADCFPVSENKPVQILDKDVDISHNANTKICI